MQDSKEKQCLIFVRNNANDTADRIEAYAKKSGMKVVETIFNTDKKAVERLRYYIERDVIICVLVRDVVDISMELNEIKAVMTLAAEHGISINAESRGYEPALISYDKQMLGIINAGEENRKLKLIIFPGETVVIDEYGKRIVACPTEDEAEEYIREQEE